jgi:hypothetical protein
MLKEEVQISGGAPSNAKSRGPHLHMKEETEENPLCITTALTVISSHINNYRNTHCQL